MSALPAPLPAEQLYRAATLSDLAFASTAELEPLEGLVGQRRALEAIEFGARIERAGFNLFVVSAPGALVRDAVRSAMGAAAEQQARPSDWVYVNSFADPTRPAAIALPAGRAPGLRDAMRETVSELKSALPAVFESEEYQTRRGAIDEAFHSKQGEAFADLQRRASERNVALLRTPVGFALIPARNGEPMEPNAFNALPEAERKAARAVIEELEKDLERIMRHIPQLEKQRRSEIRALNQEVARAAVAGPIDELKEQFADLPRIAEHLEQVRADLVENIPIFVLKAGDGESEAAEMMPGGPFDRYQVNVVVAQAAEATGAPVVEELHPTLANLTGRVEHIARQGVLVTSFRLIRAGALHKANGGILIIDARNLLTEPFSWAALKRVLRRREIVIEDLNRLIGLTSTIALEPDPIPFDGKIVLVGDRLVHMLLVLADPELGEHFKVLAEFEDDLDRSPESELMFARAIGSILRREALRPIDRSGLGLVVEHAARLAENGGKLTLAVDQLRDILAEADYWARAAGREVIARADVRRALDQRLDRASRLRDRVHEQILRGVTLVETGGTRVGQVNGLSVFQLGEHAFGRPSRITCQVRAGPGTVVGIEREVELGGPIHSKGVLILSGFLAGRFALDTPMSLQASLVFEQSYGGIEGDSASSAELYALLSALAQVGLRQDLAVTGSVNQHGEVQAIGGVNEKVEGFFDVCQARGLSGTQGVLIPAANVQHLMLREDITEACRQGRFAVYAVSTVDEGIALLTGRAAGARGADGKHPEGTIYRLVEDRLTAFAEIRRSFGQPAPAPAPQ